MIPRLRLVVFLWVLAAPQLVAYQQPSFDELIKLEGNTFLEAAQEATVSFYEGKCPYSVDQLIAIAEKCSSSVKPIGSLSTGEFGMNPLGDYVAEACKKANERQLDKLLELYLRLDPNSNEKSQTLPVVAARVLAREVASIPPRDLELASADEPALLPELESASQELQSAWRAFQRAKAPFEKAFPKMTEVIEVSTNMKSFYDVIGEALKGATGREDEVRRFAWNGANCLGITDIEDAQDIALLLMLLRERRTNEAIGAALRVAGTQGSTSSPELLTKPVIDLFERCGVNWEEVFAGGQAEIEARGWAFESRHPYLDALASYGSDRGALLVKDLARFAKPDGRDKYLPIFGAWVETTPKLNKCKGEKIFFSGSGQKPRIAKPMSKAVQEMALHLSEELATPESSEFQADIAVDTFARTQTASSITALQALTRHHSGVVARHAEAVLCAMGQELDRQRVDKPVRFQITLNGKPLTAGEQVSWSTIAREYSMGTDATVQADGVVEIPRERFANRKYPVTEVRFHKSQMVEEGVIFDTRLSPPWDFDGTTKVDIQLSALEITLRNRDGLNAPPSGKAFVSIVRFDKEAEGQNESPGLQETKEEVDLAWPYLFQDGNEVTADPAIRLPAIQRGRCEIYIGVLGAEVWKGIVVVGGKAQTIVATLKPGSDLRFEIVAPGGLRGFWAPLFKDGKQVDLHLDSRTKTYRALSCGNYVLKIAGSDPEGQNVQGKKLARGPDEIPFVGRDVSFKVEKGSPAVIDLGEIQLEPLSR